MCGQTVPSIERGKDRFLVTAGSSDQYTAQHVVSNVAVFERHMRGVPNEQTEDIRTHMLLPLFSRRSPLLRAPSTTSPAA